ncbi:unnamed protein product [Schistosoma curassoni]|uniref:Uncharacterized protein n=1 Tax=Schistosoma curassoni TaxID=6186 RepID=A0A183K7L5_9TREM|nr:unnamed protein product [Schistosoma curassoni]
MEKDNTLKSRDDRDEEDLNIRSLCVRDRNSGLNILVNMGAAPSVIPQNKTELGQKTITVSLQASDKTKIATFGRKR